MLAPDWIYGCLIMILFYNKDPYETNWYFYLMYDLWMSELVNSLEINFRNLYNRSPGKREIFTSELHLTMMERLVLPTQSRTKMFIFHNAKK